MGGKRVGGGCESERCFREIGRWLSTNKWSKGKKGKKGKEPPISLLLREREIFPLRRQNSDWLTDCSSEYYRFSFSSPQWFFVSRAMCVCEGVVLHRLGLCHYEQSWYTYLKEMGYIFSQRAECRLFQQVIQLKIRVLFLLSLLNVCLMHICYCTSNRSAREEITVMFLWLMQVQYDPTFSPKG